MSRGESLAIAEGWVKGPSATQPDDPTKLQPIIAELMSKARLNSDMTGKAAPRGPAGQATQGDQPGRPSASSPTSCPGRLETSSPAGRPESARRSPGCSGATAPAWPSPVARGKPRSRPGGAPE